MEKRAFNPALETFNTVGSAFIPGYRAFTPAPQRRLTTAGLAAAGERTPWEEFTYFTHAECNLAVFLILEAGGARREIEIGVSKDSCWLCLLFLCELSKATNVPIVVSKNHQHVYHHWLLPAALPQALAQRIRQAMTQRMLDEVSVVVQAAHEKTASLSGSNSPESNYVTKIRLPPPSD
jgi:hypothetical protein